jgi:hypothetical protein
MTLEERLRQLRSLFLLMWRSPRRASQVMRRARPEGGDMERANKLQDLSNTAVEALQLALIECREASTEGLILAALALVAQMQHEAGIGGGRGGSRRLCPA